MGVAAVTGLAFFVEHVADFRCIGGVADPALLVKDPYFDHARLVRHGLNRVVQSLAIVTQHVVGCAAVDDIAKAFGASQRGGFQILAMQPDIQISEQAENHKHDHKQRPDQFCADTIEPDALIPGRCELVQSPAWVNTGGANTRSASTSFRGSRGLTACSSSPKIGRYFTATPNSAKPIAMIINVMENSVHFGT